MLPDWEWFHPVHWIGLKQRELKRFERLERKPIIVNEYYQKYGVKF